jgi:NitT/TauT family transport system ATP-binding protein
MLQLRRIQHQFPQIDRKKPPLAVIDDVSLTIEDGTFVSFLGPSGCGKTTLLRIIDGLVRPTRGQVIVDGKVVQRPSPDRAMVFQEFNLLPWRTSQRNAELGLEIQGVEGSNRAAAAGQALNAAGLEGFGQHFPYQLSGGMKQRVGLARALCTAPRYLLMDEPFGALDPQIRELMQIELMRLWEQDRKTVVFVTHSVDEAIFLSDRIVMFSARPGTVLETIDITLPRPRWTNDEAVKASTAFVDYRLRIWHLLKQQLQASRAGGAAAVSAFPAPVE